MCNYTADSDILTDSYCEYFFMCDTYPTVRYQCYNNQSRFDNCSTPAVFSSDRLILNITAFIEQYQQEITICARLIDNEACSLETTISNYTIFAINYYLVFRNNWKWYYKTDYY